MNLNDLMTWLAIFFWSGFLLLVALGGATWWERHRDNAAADDQAVLEAVHLANEDRQP